MQLYASFTIFFFIIRTGAQENCESLEKCSDCIQKLGCVWCSDPVDRIHCKMEHSTSDLSRWCSADKLMKPQTSNEIIENDELNTAVIGEPVQIKPQRIKITMRKGEAFTIPFQYARSSNYPVDMYYIFDLSYSMKVHVDKMAELADTLIKVMQNTTKDFRLGFGSFVDKPKMPFTSPTIIQEEIPTYSFKNHLSLTKDYSKFAKEVREANLSTNIDLPEGGFDALMQAIVCDEIGWRDEATRLIVLSTDATYHIAGDGKLGGLYEPNDMQCHLNGNEYLYLSEQDYPSVGQLDYVMRRNDVHLLFAIRINENDIYERTFEDYEQLTHILPNTYARKLLNDSSNVVNLIKDVYNQITVSVHISDNAPSNVQITYHNDKCEQSIACTNIQIGETVNFNATIKLLTCPSSPGQYQQIRIKPEGIHEALLIDLEAICSCDCESSTSSDYIKDSPRCNGTGDDICGPIPCLRQFRNLYLWTKGQLCSGPDHGTCKCGQCECLLGWSGEDCGCSTSTATCMARNSQRGKVCSGRGQCVCGACKCDEDVEYFGRYCEESPSDPGQRCSELFECIKAVVYNITSLDENDIKDLNCTNHNFRLIGCTVVFTYKYLEDEKLDIEVQEESFCRKALDVWVIVAIVLSILLGGLIMLVIWKVFMHVHDTREYAKFLEHTQDSKWSAKQNPIYKQASTTFTNPTYNRN
ncbi:hypothetical protein Trydic_g20202 [Trypoxylus dichotomus]